MRRAAVPAAVVERLARRRSVIGPDARLSGAILSELAEQKPAQIIREQLSRYLGPFTATNAVKMFADQALSTDPDNITPAQVPTLLEALSPMLRTLLGKDGAQNVIDQVRREVERRQ